MGEIENDSLIRVAVALLISCIVSFEALVKEHNHENEVILLVMGAIALLPIFICVIIAGLTIIGKGRIDDDGLEVLCNFYTVLFLVSWSWAVVYITRTLFVEDKKQHDLVLAALWIFIVVGGLCQMIIIDVSRVLKLQRLNRAQQAIIV